MFTSLVTEPLDVGQKQKSFFFPVQVGKTLHSVPQIWYWLLTPDLEKQSSSQWPCYMNLLVYHQLSFLRKPDHRFTRMLILLLWFHCTSHLLYILMSVGQSSNVSWPLDHYYHNPRTCGSEGTKISKEYGQNEGSWSCFVLEGRDSIFLRFFFSLRCWAFHFIIKLSVLRFIYF